MAMCNIETSEIESDIKITQVEIDRYENEIEILSKNPSENKVAIYLREGCIAQRKEFVRKLRDILKLRKEGLVK